MAEIKEKVNHPLHYNTHPSGIECIDIIEHMNFCLGNVIKYIWRAEEKENDIEDLEKAEFYLKREIARRKNGIQDQKERTREVNQGKHSEGYWFVIPEGFKLEAYNEEGSLPIVEYNIQHYSAFEDY